MSALNTVGSPRLHSEVEAMQLVLSDELRRKGVQSHGMEVTHCVCPLEGDALCKRTGLFSMWSLQARVCECGPFGWPCEQAFFGACRLVFASIYIRLFAGVHKRPLYRSMAPFESTHLFCCCMTPHLSLNITATERRAVMQQIDCRYMCIDWGLGTCLHVCLCIFVCGGSVMCCSDLWTFESTKTNIQSFKFLKWFTDLLTHYSVNEVMRGPLQIQSVYQISFTFLEPWRIKFIRI